jgi:hypothetical protein
MLDDLRPWGGYNKLTPHEQTCIARWAGMIATTLRYCADLVPNRPTTKARLLQLWGKPGLPEAMRVELATFDGHNQFAAIFSSLSSESYDADAIMAVMAFGPLVVKVVDWPNPGLNPISPARPGHRPEQLQIWPLQSTAFDMPWPPTDTLNVSSFNTFANLVITSPEGARVIDARRSD